MEHYGSVKGVSKIPEGLKSACPRPPMPLPWMLGIMGRELGDTKHSGSKLTASRMYGCPRTWLIGDNVPLVFDPTSANQPTWGTAVHDFMEKWAPPGVYAEFPVKGVLFGEAVEGTIDFLSPDMVVLEDFKASSESKHQRKWEKGVDVEYFVQANIYRLLTEQSQPELSIKRMAIWNGAMCANAARYKKDPAPPWFEAEVPFMSEDEIGAQDTRRSGHTVRGIVEMYRRFMDRLTQLKAAFPVETPEYVEAFNQALKETVPPVGHGGWGGAECDYCGPAREYCDALEGIVATGG